MVPAGSADELCSVTSQHAAAAVVAGAVVDDVADAVVAANLKVAAATEFHFSGRRRKID